MSTSSYSAFSRSFLPIKGFPRPVALRPFHRILESHAKSPKNVSIMWYFLKLVFFIFSFMYVSVICCWNYLLYFFRAAKRKKRGLENFLPLSLWTWESESSMIRCFCGGWWVFFRCMHTHTHTYIVRPIVWASSALLFSFFGPFLAEIEYSVL